MKADLHMHTKFSIDAVPTPKQVVDTAIEKGIDCICITDHGQVQGAVEAMKYAFDKNILVIPGIEVFSRSGDIIGINVKKDIPGYLPAKEAIEEIRRQGGIAVIPHPFRPFSMGFLGGASKIKELSPDAIESFNAADIFSFANKRAVNFTIENNFPFTAGSDAHRKEYIGQGYIEFDEKVMSEKDLVKVIMEKRAKTGGKIMGPISFIKNSNNNSVIGLIKYFKDLRRNKRDYS